MCWYRVFVGIYTVISVISVLKMRAKLLISYEKGVITHAKTCYSITFQTYCKTPSIGAYNLYIYIYIFDYENVHCDTFRKGLWNSLCGLNSNTQQSQMRRLTSFYSSTWQTQSQFYTCVWGRSIGMTKRRESGYLKKDTRMCRLLYVKTQKR